MHPASIERAAERVLWERTGLDRIYLRQFEVFGGTNRREDGLLPVLRVLDVPVEREHWVLNRIVSVPYLALVDFAEATPKPDARIERLYSELDARASLSPSRSSATASSVLPASLRMMPMHWCAYDLCIGSELAARMRPASRRLTRPRVRDARGVPDRRTGRDPLASRP